MKNVNTIHEQVTANREQWFQYRRTMEANLATLETLYAAAVAALPAGDIDHHASDLYLKRTPAAVALVGRLDNTALLSVFRDSDGVAWYELPFCFSPYWENPSKYY